MVFKSSERGDQYARIGSGVDEAQCHPGSGLRTDTFTYLLEHLPTQHALFSAGASSYTNHALTLTRQVLPCPCTPCISLIRSAGSTATRTVRFRVQGIDQFGNYIEELTPTITTVEPVHVNAASYIWCSKVFSQITNIEMTASGLTTTPDPVTTFPDLIAVGTQFFFDRSKGRAVVFNDASGGDFTLGITPPGGAVETTGAIPQAATAAQVKAAIEALTQFASIGATVDVSGAGTFNNPWTIDFNGGAIRDQDDIVANDGGLTGATNGSTVTGFEFWGHDNLGVGLPRKIQAYRKGQGTNFHPDVQHVQIQSMQRSRVLALEYPITANTLANPTVVTLSKAHGYKNTDKFFVLIRGSNSTPVIDGAQTATGTTSRRQFTLPINVTGAGTAGTATIMELPRDGTMIIPAGTAADRSTGAAGYRLGINATDLTWQGGGSEKLGLYLDSSRTAGAHVIAVNGYNWSFGANFNQNFLLSITCRASKGSGADPSSTVTYPR